MLEEKTEVARKKPFRSTLSPLHQPYFKEASENILLGWGTKKFKNWWKSNYTARKYSYLKISIDFIIIFSSLLQVIKIAILHSKYCFYPSIGNLVPNFNNYSISWKNCSYACFGTIIFKDLAILIWGWFWW